MSKAQKRKEKQDTDTNIKSILLLTALVNLATAIANLIKAIL